MTHDLLKEIHQRQAFEEGLRTATALAAKAGFASASEWFDYLAKQPKGPRTSLDDSIDWAIAKSEGRE